MKTTEQELADRISEMMRRIFLARETVRLMGIREGTPEQELDRLLTEAARIGAGKEV